LPAYAIVTRNIGCELGHPEPPPGLGHIGETAPGVPMPETPVHEDNQSVLRKHDVRSSRKVLSVQTEPISVTV
jgi:hypothetical protein